MFLHVVNNLKCFSAQGMEMKPNLRIILISFGSDRICFLSSLAGIIMSKKDKNIFIDATFLKV